MTSLGSLVYAFRGDRCFLLALAVTSCASYGLRTACLGTPSSRFDSGGDGTLGHAARAGLAATR
eukprot:8454691-Alexandrium_andersonii.AAC.1